MNNADIKILKGIHLKMALNGGFSSDERNAVIKAFRELEKMQWMPVEECLPQPHTDVIVDVQEFGEDTFRMIDCLVEGDGGKLMWSTYNGALERVLAWMPLPERYNPGK